MAKDTNIYEESARRAKVQHLITHFESRGITADHIRAAHPQVLEHYARAAGLAAKMPSPETWTQVADTMEHIQHTRAQLAGKNPFEGLG